MHFFRKKWQKENDDGMYMVFFDDQRQTIYNSMTETLGGDAMYKQEILERLFSEIALIN